MPGSLTKEPPLFHFDNALSAITPGMHYSQLLRLQDTDERVLRGVPGLIRERFLLIDNEEIVFDRFLALIDAEGVDSLRVRKVMYFLWTYRDHRVRNFILNVITDDRGHWSTDQLYDKNNSEFFEQTHTEGSAKKARSNIERFLTAETGIVIDNTVHLELDDGWLEEAVRVAAQHEPDETIRRRMYTHPVEFVIDQAWNGLANATIAELRAYSEGTALLKDGAEEDQDLGPATAAVLSRGLEGKTWNRQQPRPGGNATTTAQINMIARERALTAHHRLEELFAQKCRILGLNPQTNELIDVYASRDGGTILAEMKSNNGRIQFRSATPGTDN